MLNIPKAITTDLVEAIKNSAAKIHPHHEKPIADRNTGLTDGLADWISIGGRISEAELKIIGSIGWLSPLDQPPLVCEGSTLRHNRPRHSQP